MQQYPPFPDPQQAPQQFPQEPPQPGPFPQLPQQETPPQSLPSFDPPPYVPPPYAQGPVPNPPFAPIPPAPSNPPRSNRNKWLIGGGIGCGVLLVLCMCAGLVGTIGALGLTPSTSSTPSATQQSQVVDVSATPTATTQPTVDANAYITTVTADSTKLGDDLNTVGDACGSGQDLSGCRAALVTARDDSKNFLADLDAHPAPSCLASVDKPLRAALKDIQTASQEVIDGIDTSSTSKVKSGISLMNKATTEIDTASSELDKANCPGV